MCRYRRLYAESPPCYTLTRVQRTVATAKTTSRSWRMFQSSCANQPGFGCVLSPAFSHLATFLQAWCVDLLSHRLPSAPLHFQKILLFFFCVLLLVHVSGPLLPPNRSITLTIPGLPRFPLDAVHPAPQPPPVHPGARRVPRAPRTRAALCRQELR